MRTIIENVLAVTMNTKGEIGACTIVIEGERISALRFTGAGGKPKSYISPAVKPGAPAMDSIKPGPGDVVIDGRGKIALPGVRSLCHRFKSACRRIPVCRNGAC